jgi:endonuclease/exonuclease/phosphatase (EEP) superfamily protein YafD
MPPARAEASALRLDVDAPGPVKRVAIAAARLAVLGALLSVVSLVPWHPLTLLEHFRLQLLVGSATAALAAGLLRQRGWFDAAAICALLDLLLVTPGLSGARAAGPSGGVTVRLLLANVRTNNPDMASVARAIEELSPDVVVLIEPNRRWFTALRPALAGYRGQREVDDAGNFGVGVYVRGELRSTVEHLGSRLPTVVAQVELDSGQAAPFTLLATHPIPPVDEGNDRSHRRQMQALAERVAALRGPVVLAGDLNATPWSRPFARLLAASGLRDSRAGFGLQATFPVSGGTSLLRLPIDHVLISSEIGVRSRRVERDLGSDHLPVLVELGLPPR